MENKMVEAVKLDKNTHERLTAYAKGGETLDVVINRILDELEEYKKRVKNKRQTLTLHTEGEENSSHFVINKVRTTAPDDMKE